MRIFEAPTKAILPPPPQGDRGFDGLSGLPGEKGNRVSHLVARWKVRMCLF